MARYTVELGTIVESGFNIFNFTYDFYDETKRIKFEQDFINHFYFREIGQETTGRFVHYLKCKMNETFPYYNMLLQTTLIEYEKTINYSLTETMERINVTSNEVNGSENVTDSNTANSTAHGTDVQHGTVDQTQHDTTNSSIDTNGDSHVNNEKNNTSITSKDSTVSTDNLTVESDTPNGMLSIGDIKSNTYASKASMQDGTQKIADDGKIIDELNEENTEEHSEHTENSISSNSTVDTTSSNTSTTDSTNNVTMNGTSSKSNNQNIDGSENENYTKTLRGSYGVITESDMLLKHINLQKTLTNIFRDFFEECEDLFMQLY